jgi:hypothetical protein
MGDRLRLAGDVGLDTEDGFHRILRRGTKLPARKTVTLRTAEAGQDRLEFALVQRLGPRWNALHRRARIDGLPEGRRGEVKVRLEVEIDGEGGLAARLKVKGRPGATELARSRVSVATREGLERALTSAGVGLLELGLLPPGYLETPEEPLHHPCEACGETISFRAISLLEPALDGLTCDTCDNVLFVTPLDNMAASFFTEVPGGRLSVTTPAASVEPPRAEGHAAALARLEEALAPCPCGGRFRALGPARCPRCRTPFVHYADDVVFRAQQTHLPLVGEGIPVERMGPELWSEAHRERFAGDLEAGPLRQEGGYTLVPLRFRNRGGWLFVPLAYALVLRDAQLASWRPFRPVEPEDPVPPERWQQLQAEADETYADEVERALGFRPLLGAVPPDEEVEGVLAFPGEFRYAPPTKLIVGRALETPVD